MYVILFVVNLIFIVLLKFIEFCWSKVLNGFFRLVLMRYFFATFLHFLELACQFDCFMHSDWLYLYTINVVTFLFTVKYIYVYSSRIMKQELYMVNILIFYIHTCFMSASFVYYRFYKLDSLIRKKLLHTGDCISLYSFFLVLYSRSTRIHTYCESTESPLRTGIMIRLSRHVLVASNEEVFRPILEVEIHLRSCFCY